jgi:hypothetical protein
MGRSWGRGAALLRTPWFGCALVVVAAWGLHGAPEADSQEVKAKAAPLDEPLAWMHEARRAYAGVKDYACTLIKRESLPTNPDDNIILFKFRDQPFSVYMRWITPNKYKGQEVAYVHGKNRNKLRVHAKGFLKGIAGFVSVDVDDARIRDCTRHNIYEAGIGYMIEKTILQWDREKKIGKTEVKIAEYEYNKKRCVRIETTHTERHPEFYCYRSIFYLDKESKLPIRAENYNWPRPGGPADGDLI